METDSQVTNLLLAVYETVRSCPAGSLVLSHVPFSEAFISLVFSFFKRQGHP